jgi:hypothetical protein
MAALFVCAGAVMQPAPVASTGFRSEADRAAMLDVFTRARAVYERLAQ